MRNLFHSSKGKKLQQQQSIRLQQELQKEEETLWKIEQEKRKLQEELDMKMARKLQEEMEQQGQQQQQQQQRPPENREPPPRELSDEEVARRLQEEFDRANSQPPAPRDPSPSPPPRRQGSPNQQLSDEQYARMLQEQFEAEERQAQQEQQRSASSPPHTHSTASDTASPSCSASAPPPLPSKPVAYNRQPSPAVGHGTSRPAWIAHSSSSSSSISVETAHSVRPSSNLGTHQQQQHQTQAPPPPYQPSSTASPSSPSPAPAVNASSFYPPQPSSPAPPAQPPSSYPANNVATPQQSMYPSASATYPPAQGPYPPSPSQQHHPPQWSAYPTAPSPAPHASQSYHAHPPSQPTPQRPTSVGTSLFSSAGANDPVMFIVPPAPHQQHQQLHQEPDEQPAFIPMPAPEAHQQRQAPAVDTNATVHHHPPSSAPYPASHVPKPPSDQQQQQQQRKPDDAYVVQSVKPARKARDPTPPPNRAASRAQPTPAADNAPVHTQQPAKKTDIDPFADSFAAQVSDDDDDDDDEESDTDADESEDEQQHAQTVPTKAAGEAAKAGQQQQQQHGFDPSRFFDEEDLVDLNATVDDDDDDVSSDDGSYVEPAPAPAPTARKPAVEMAVQTDPIDEDEDGSSNQAKDKPTVGHEVEAVKDAGVESKGIQTPSAHEQAGGEERPKEEEDAKAKPVVPEASLLDLDFEPEVVEPPPPVARPESRPRAISSVDTRAEIQRRLAEQNKKYSVTRVDPTFGISMGPPPAPANKTGSNKIQEQDEGDDDNADDDQREKDDKIQATVDPQHPIHTPSPEPSMLYHQRSQSASGFFPPATGHMQHATPYMNHLPYDDMAYAPTPMVYPANVLRAGAPPIMSPELAADDAAGGGMVAAMDNSYPAEVPSNEYGYYRVDNHGNPANDDTDAKSTKSSMAPHPKDKELPKIPKSDPNHRHITVPSVNPGQRVWIRVKPTDSGKALAQRIHVVATYKSRKILSIKTTSGRDIPLDDSPVFDDWTEIANLEDGAPWEVEWGAMDHPFSGGRELFKSIKASFLAGKD